MTYIERLQDVNGRLNTRDIRGKEYAEVNQRILGFWELFPEGRIECEWLELTEARAVCFCRVWKDGGGEAPTATGTAYEVKAGSGVNSTSYIENAETSAVGRALGMLGIGATNAIASAEEVAGAIAAQEAVSDSKPRRRAAGPKADKSPAKPAKSPQKPRESATGAKEPQDATEAARVRLIDACNLLAAASGRDAKEIMRHVASQDGFEKTKKGYTAAAEWVEAALHAQGVQEV